ncbi:MAG: iron-containing alcohol dehydrogenase [bacterium]
MNSDFYEFFCPVKVISGLQALSNLPHEMDQLSVHRALVITDKGVAGAGLIKHVEAAFEGSNCSIGHIFEETPVDSSNVVVNQVADLFHEKKCDCFVAVGGGSCIDTAKGANIVVTEETDDLMKFRGAERLKKPMKPLLVVPTTAGTGSEVTLVAVISNVQAGVKMAFTSDRLYPNVAILDPKMTLTLPPKITAATGMDALTHAIEAYCSLQKNPISDSLALSAIKLIAASLVKCVENGSDERARLSMANASLLAGMAFSNAMVGVVHALAHAAGGVCHVPHGVANAVLLPFGMEHNLGKRAAVIAELASELCARETAGCDMERARAAIQAVRDLNKKLNELSGLPNRLRDAGVPEDKLEAIARVAINDGSIVYNPEDVTFEEALGILRLAY